MDKFFEFVVNHPDLAKSVVDLLGKVIDAAQNHPQLMDALAARIKGHA